MKKLLIANRGEIACRIIRTARRMGIATVAVYSEADAHAPHVAAADEAVLIGPAPARESYLLPEKILEAARATGADAIHPGYGFLSENADFAEAVRKAGLIFVGPSDQAIRVMGLKDSAKTKMKTAGVPVTPGYMGDDQSLPRLERMAEMIGYPLLIKAVAGGGGKGMRPVHAKAEFTEALLAAKREAAASFGHDGVMLEKLIATPRHVEVQIFGDSHGNIVHLFERDCSLQRRHQKVIEEAPAPGLSGELRHVLGIAAVTAGHAIGYENAGTVEFILDMDDRDEAGDPKFYFMEMNTRLQVEHPVTEAITGQDLVEWQIRIARGEMLPLMQDAIECHGHAVEARLYAENPDRGFLPSTGTLSRLAFGEGARIDTGVEQGGEVTVHYDPMIAKVITHAPTRDEALAKLVAALDRTVVEGVTTNRGFLARLAAHPAFVGGEIDTGFIARHEVSLFESAPPPPSVLAAAAAQWAAATPAQGPFAHRFRLNLPPVSPAAFWEADGTEHRFEIAPDGVRFEGAAQAPGRDTAIIAIEGGVEARRRGQSWRFLSENPGWAGHSAAGPADGQILAPMPGKLIGLFVKPGDKVQAGDRLAVLEAMKMEHRLTAPFDGTVEAVSSEAGAQVADGMLLVTLARAGEPG
ncbi:acetyl/propionyl/methylcrotonyl-CoA carboxylase subunit alpha [Sandaracinobacter neustonicus]|uniref:Acetyl/propionyl/methylcrotonyl-CoA carboxylase subunit alpha n=1 Tax=Sandaracinobacter neustonicus TaxID=1715348 RepID=A0A501XDR6_9SPHN|nr:acetyl/propionyl/methylcrotonyl-CoA carboxylase subunit alpha [Sandaracinobacter neustonicus]TPE58636.1 acetyl/propionyl/methylcrotonyl-CoA carboxylase subunit alpha [Sandaracinobacter neustonicus]